MDNNLILVIAGSLIAVNFDWVDPFTKIGLVIIALVGLVIKILEYKEKKRNNRQG